MGSVEHDERMYDGGNRLASQETIDMEHACARMAARERVENRLDRRDEYMLEVISDRCYDQWKEATRLLGMGKRDEAMTLWTQAVEDAIEREIAREAQA